ncbi:MAG: GIY-YIG nuclease family protein [bacterium]|nr:GIY-YIG nuclease family protein [bacterium]
MTHIVYILFSNNNGQFYTGYTNNLLKRLKEHNSGKVLSTKYRLPLILVYYEVCGKEKDARAREKYLKSGMGKRYINNRIKGHLKTIKKKI